jgi:hypothetical protein
MLPTPVGALVMKRFFGASVLGFSANLGQLLRPEAGRLTVHRQTD